MVAEVKVAAQCSQSSAMKGRAVEPVCLYIAHTLIISVHAYR